MPFSCHPPLADSCSSSSSRAITRCLSSCWPGRTIIFGVRCFSNTAWFSQRPTSPPRLHRDHHHPLNRPMCAQSIPRVELMLEPGRGGLGSPRLGGTTSPRVSQATHTPQRKLSPRALARDGRRARAAELAAAVPPQCAIPDVRFDQTSLKPPLKRCRPCTSTSCATLPAFAQRTERATCLRARLRVSVCRAPRRRENTRDALVCVRLALPEPRRRAASQHEGPRVVMTWTRPARCCATSEGTCQSCLRFGPLQTGPAAGHRRAGGPGRSAAPRQ